jgi:hypothetical protein
METLGHGNFSYAQSTTGGKDFVLKVSKSPVLYKQDGWWKFAKLAQMKHPTNKIFPNILYTGALHRSPSDEHKIGVAIIERLTPWNKLESDITEAAVENLFTYAIHADPKKKDDQTIKMFYPTLSGLGISVKDVFDFSKSVAKHVQTSWDLHDENFGVRADGSFVIFDPVAWVE